jgi:hypothetical protein
MAGTGRMAFGSLAATEPTLTARRCSPRSDLDQVPITNAGGFANKAGMFNKTRALQNCDPINELAGRAEPAPGARLVGPRGGRNEVPIPKAPGVTNEAGMFNKIRVLQNCDPIDELTGSAREGEPYMLTVIPDLQKPHQHLTPRFVPMSLLITACFFLMTLTARAQDTATLVGTVTDTSGAVVPGAKVSVTNPDRGFVRDVLSNSAGEYTAARIPIGNYVVTVEMAGFEKLVRSGISLTAGQEQRVDLTLTVGQISQQVSVSGNVTRVETESPTLSDVVTSKQIQNLTLNGLNFGALTFLVPGAVQDNSYSEAQQLGHAGAEVGVSFNGNREEYSNLELDGGNNSQESSTAMGGAVTPAIDMIAEFRISTSNYGADVGQHAGALVEIATKGGTKQFHGDGYEFVRNDALDANDWFANQQIAPPDGNAPKTPLKWNIFGYTFGGPFYIPHHYNTDKSKTFFFWSQEWARYRQASVITAGAPTPAMRQGDFSQCDPSSSNYVPLLVQQGCVLPTVNGVKVDSVPVSPNAAALMNAYVPLPK